MSRLDDHLRRITEADHLGGLWCASRCVRRADPRVLGLAEDNPDYTETFHKVLAHVKSAVRGEPVDVNQLGTLMWEELTELDETRGHIIGYIVTSSRWLLTAVMRAFGNPERPNPQFELRLAVHEACHALAWSRVSGTTPPRNDEEMVALSCLVENQLVLAFPTPQDVQGARSGVSVAWDWLQEQGAEPMGGVSPTGSGGLPVPLELRVDRLLDNVRRSFRLGLDWDSTIERAVAERCPNDLETQVKALLEIG